MRGNLSHEEQTKALLEFEEACVREMRSPSKQSVDSSSREGQKSVSDEMSGNWEEICKTCQCYSCKENRGCLRCGICTFNVEFVDELNSNCVDRKSEVSGNEYDGET